MYIEISLIILLLLVFILTSSEKFVSKSYLQLVPYPDIDPSIFNGFWLYETPDKSVQEFLAIEAIDNNFLNIRKKLIAEPLLKPGTPPEYSRKQNITTEYPLFRFIPITKTRVQISPVRHTYSMSPINIQLVETTRGRALIINGNYYYTSGITF